MASPENRPGRKILAAVDEGEESMNALSWCLSNVVAERKDTVVVLYAVPHRPVYAPVDGTGYLFSDEIIEDIDRHAEKVAASVLDTAKNICKDFPQIKVETKAEKGDPRDIICRIADELNCDLIVLGSHGYGVIKRAFLGSVSDYCAHNANCPVLLVKKTDK